MAMTARNAEGELVMEINTTPLIDVMLVLLTLLILTLPVQTHVLKLNMPTITPPTSPPTQTVDLRVDFDGSIYWNGSAVDRATLGAHFKHTLAQMPQPEIHLNANALAKYDTVAMVLGDAQRLGVAKIGFTGMEQYQP